MSVRKHTWMTAEGEKSNWLVDYKDGAGKRRAKTFEKKRDADAFHAKVKVDVREGVHVAESATVTVSQACDNWLATSHDLGLEASTLAQYEQHSRLHIKPFLGATKLSKMSVATVRAFEDKLRENGRSPAMVKGIVASLGSIIADSQERGLIARNPVREMSRRRTRKANGSKKNGRRQLEPGRDIPKPEEIRIIMRHARGLRVRVMLLTFATAGLRASEFRGLRWTDLDLQEKKPALHVRQRADYKNEIGPPKSKSGTRTIPLTPATAAGLRLWRKQCPRNKQGELHYVFPTGKGKIENHGNIKVRVWWAAQIAAGIVKPKVKKDGSPVQEPVKGSDGKVIIGNDGKPVLRDVMVAKYSGLHALRHFFASWCINRKTDGGLELPGKVVQQRLGHSTIAMTMDRYGHLFPQGDDTSELARGEKALLG